MTPIKMYDASNIDRMEWPESEEGRLAKSYLLPLIKEGPDRFIANAKTSLYILTIDEQIIPISVNEAEYENSYLLSSYFVAANFKEKAYRATGLARVWSKPLSGLFSQLLKWMKVNKVVIINNWLMTTNIYPELSEEQIKALTAFLKEHFPDHYLMFRSINNYKSSSVFDSLNLENYRMISSRNIYLYDPKRKAELSSSTLRKQRKDMHKIAKSNYRIETVQTLSKDEIERILDLYQNVYVSRYTKYSPIYTEKYLRYALENKILNLKLLKKENRIYGVTGFLKKNGFLLTPFFGYDTSLPHEEGLYRMLSGIIMQEIEKEELVSHQGSGAADFKKWRGCIEEKEYVAIYDHHLPFFRRLFWYFGEKLSSKIHY
ncbi:MAG: hypothetical protein JJU12_08385 [Chlamydiales bacterium]|nr:hypothetical protein [Chlamydiales bacterium]